MFFIVTQRTKPDQYRLKEFKTVEELAEYEREVDYPLSIFLSAGRIEIMDWSIVRDAPALKFSERKKKDVNEIRHK